MDGASDRFRCIVDGMHATPRLKAEKRRIHWAVALGLLIAFEVAAGLALGEAFAVSLCALFGETCTQGEKTAQTALLAVGVGVGVGGPILVAWLRREVAWVMAPLVLVALANAWWLANS